MKLKPGHPRVRGPRASVGRGNQLRGSRRSGVEPSTFAWTEPLADVEPLVVERSVYIDRPIEIEKQVFIDRQVSVEVEKPVIVEKPVLVEKIVEKETVVEKKVFVDRPVEVEKIVYVDRPTEAKQGEQSEKSKKAATPAPKPKAIVIGRGPSLATKIGRIMPSPSPAFAGAATLLIMIGGFALMSPSSENAGAARSSSSYGVEATERAQESTETLIGAGQTSSQGNASARDPFASTSFKAPVKKPATSKDAAASKSAATPAVATASLYASNFTTYTSYSPWTKSVKRPGGWLNFGGKPTVKVVSVGKAGVDLFVVTDVEVIPEKSKNFKHDKPLRQVHLNKGGVVRFADYRDIQGEDVTYTIRYGGSQLIKQASKK